jgi:hypothetical protein
MRISRPYASPLLAGRAFDAHDIPTSLKVAVINELLAKKDWPGENPIGKTFSMTVPGSENVVYQVIGVSADTRYRNLRSDPAPVFYLSSRQAPDRSSGTSFAVRSHIPEAELLPSLRAAVRGIDRDLPLVNVRTQMEQIDEITMNERMFADLTGGFAYWRWCWPASGSTGP